MLQQLLASTVLETEDTISLCLSMAGALADQARCSRSSQAATGAATEGSDSILARQARGNGAAAAAAGGAEGAASGTRSAAAEAGASAESPCQLLELSAELLEYCRQQALALQQQGAAAAGQDQSSVVLHIQGIQQQVGLLDRQHLVTCLMKMPP